MGKKKTKTSSTETSHAVTTPSSPAWVTSGVQGLGERISQLGAVDPRSFVAPLSGLERQAADRAGGLNSAESEGWISQMMGRPSPSASSASLLDNLSAYSNSYRRDVVDTTLADFDYDAGRTRATQDLAMAGQGAFGGSGAALARSQTEGELARARSSQVSKLLADMFTTSAGLSSQDADRRQQASIANANLGQQDFQFRSQFGLERDANTRANIASQAALGQQLRAAEQAYRDAPLTALSRQVDMFSGLPLSLFQGSTTDSTGTRKGTETTTGATLAELASAFASAASGAKTAQSMLPGGN